jgi:methyl-accepting chemotaxis protein
MLANLTSSPLTLGFLAAGQAGLVTGVVLGWNPALYAGLSLGCSVATALGVWGMARARRQLQQQVGDHVNRLASGDLTQDVPVQGDRDTQQLLGALQSLQTSLRQALGTIRGGAEGVAVAAKEIAGGNADLSARTEQTASSLQQAASSMGELTGTVNQTAESARTANQLASSASEVAQRGGSVVSQVVSTMEDINSSSKKIADIIGTIDGIAFQTNILALNAAVEAARAGEQGRGFAVVAGEVRSLAQRSAEAAREIKSLINSSVEKVESGSRLVADAGNTMTEIVASVQRVTDIIGEISAAAAEQSSGIGQVSQAVADLDQMTQQNATLVEQSAAAAQSLQDQSGNLTSAMAGFKLQGPYQTTQPRPKAVASQALAKARKAAPAAPAPAPRQPAAAANTEEWETF